MDYQGIVDYMSGIRTIVRNADDWHLHDRNVEQAVRYDLEVLDNEIDECPAFMNRAFAM